MSTVWDDERVRRGIRAQSELLDQRLAAGEELVGWKVGFGSDQALRSLGIAAPLIGFMTTKNVLASGATVSLAGWTEPLFEPEVAVHMRHSLGGNASREEVRSAIGAIGPAIELVDIDVPLDDLERIVGTNVCHRHVVLGEPDGGRGGGNLSGLRIRVTNQTGEQAATDDLVTYPGELIEVVGHVAGWLAASGKKLEPGQVIIGGSIVPSVRVAPGDRVEYECEPLDRLAVSFAD